MKHNTSVDLSITRWTSNQDPKTGISVIVTRDSRIVTKFDLTPEQFALAITGAYIDGIDAFIPTGKKS